MRHCIPLYHGHLRARTSRPSNSPSLSLAPGRLRPGSQRPWERPAARRSDASWARCAMKPRFWPCGAFPRRHDVLSDEALALHAGRLEITNMQAGLE
ncbi:hypothetical protein VFPBJ_00201 [Purpureocillium lilacinum]|uniref:Uncharacterized protein n=1 Tax=Purpureocillium lilacinum TaxID=33203 RepID=A0A179H9E9_PURLI|nr:hypothetical protein VFPBJ_00201 [Purpureocillium lilacinum]